MARGPIAQPIEFPSGGEHYMLDSKEKSTKTYDMVKPVVGCPENSVNRRKKRVRKGAIVAVAFCVLANYG
jgi:hypothetical protein